MLRQSREGGGTLWWKRARSQPRALKTKPHRAKVNNSIKVALAGALSWRFTFFPLVFVYFFKPLARRGRSAVSALRFPSSCLFERRFLLLVGLWTAGSDPLLRPGSSRVQPAVIFMTSQGVGRRTARVSATRRGTSTSQKPPDRRRAVRPHVFRARRGASRSCAFHRLIATSRINEI